MMGRQTALMGFAVAVITGLSALVLPALGRAGMDGMAAGDAQVSRVPVNPQRARTLVAYIHAQHLLCLQCHAVSDGGPIPSFAAVAANYAHQPAAEHILARRIAHGIRSMPPRLANDAQAARLAKMILGLYAAE